MSWFQVAKDQHRFYGHGVFVIQHRFYGHGVFVITEAVDSDRGFTWIQNVCKGVGCEETIPHAWVDIVFKDAPAMKCKLCGFIWQPHMHRPKVTCEQIITSKSSPKRKKTK